MSRALALLLASACLTACATNPRGTPRGLIRLPLTRQSTPYTCGVAALQSILRYYGEDIREDALGRELQPDPEQGTRYWKIVEAAQRRGIGAQAKLDATLEDLKRSLDAGSPVIVAFQAWPDKPADWAQDWDDGHYAVAIGHDDRNIYFMDPSTLGNYAYIPIPEFLARWHDQYDQTRVHHLMLVFSKDKADYETDRILRLE